MIGRSLRERLQKLFASVGKIGLTEAESSGEERLAIPHTFKPSLSFAHAMIAVAGALTRIMCGSLLFAFWGAFTIRAWQSKETLAIRVLEVLGLSIGFSLLMTALFLTVSLLVSRFSRSNAPASKQ